MAKLSLDRAYVPDPEHVAHDLVDDEVLIIDHRTGVYYSVTGTGATTWAQLTGGSAADIVDRLAAAYGADADQVARDVEAFLESLFTDQLVIETDPDPSGEASTAVTGSVDGAWAAPQLDRYTDMRDLLLFDPIHEVDQTGWPNVGNSSSQ